MADAPEPRTTGFSVADLAAQLAAFQRSFPGARADASGVVFAADAAALRLPLAAPRALADERVGDYAERLEARAEVQLLLLLQAGAMAFGCWRGGDLVQHKAVRKYVVRGNGKSQATHLKTRGKSRYGSRLRLQNWKRLLGETNARLAECEAVSGPFERIFFAAPVRVWPELFAADPAPPFGRDDDRLQRVAMHVHRPDHDELLRVRRRMMAGRLELPT